MVGRTSSTSYWLFTTFVTTTGLSVVSSPPRLSLDRFQMIRGRYEPKGNLWTYTVRTGVSPDGFDKEDDKEV